MDCSKEEKLSLIGPIWRWRFPGGLVDSFRDESGSWCQIVHEPVVSVEGGIRFSWMAGLIPALRYEESYC